MKKARLYQIFCLLIGFLPLAVSQNQNSSLTSTSDTTEMFFHEPEQQVFKISKSSEIGYEKTYPDSKIDWIVRVVRPFRKKGLFNPLLKANQAEIEDFVRTYFPDYLLLYYLKDPENKKRCKVIILLDKAHIHDFSAIHTKNPSKTALFLARRLPSIKFPRSIEVYEDLLKMASTQKEAEEILEYAPDRNSWFKAITTIVGFEKDTEGVIKKATDEIQPGEDRESLICICALRFNKTTSDFNRFLKDLGCNPVDIARKAKGVLGCNELVSLSDSSIPTVARAEYLAEIEYHVASCVGKQLKWHKYYDVFRTNGQHIEIAYENQLTFSITQNQHWAFLSNHKNLAEDFREGTISIVKNSISTKNELISFNKIFSKDKDIEWSLNWAINNLEVEDIQGLFSRTIYASHSEIVKNRIMLMAQNSKEYGYLFIKIFPFKNENLKAIYSSTIELEEDTLKRDDLIIEVVDKFGEDAFSIIKDRMTPRIAFMIARESDAFREKMTSRCLGYVDNMYWFNQFASLFEGSVDLAFERIIPTLSAGDLRNLHNDYSSLNIRIGEVYLDVAKTVEDIKWFLANYKDNPRREDAYKLGISFEEQEHGVGGNLMNLIVKYIKEFDLNLSIVKEYIACGQMLVFLERIKPASQDWYEQLADICLSCADATTLSDYEKHFGGLPEFQKKVQAAFLSSMRKAEKTRAQNSPLGIPKLKSGETVSKELPLNGISNAVLVFESDKISSDMEIVFHIGKEELINPINNDTKVIFLPSGAKKVNLQFTYKGGKGIFAESSTKPIKVSLFECPPMLRDHLETIMNSADMRKKLKLSCDKLLNGKAERNDFLLILGQEFLRFTEKTIPLDTELKALAARIAYFYLDIAKPYFPKSNIGKLLLGLERIFENKVNALGDE